MIDLDYFKLLFRTLKYKHIQDRAEIKYLLRHILPGQTVLDIGSHKAGYLYFMIQGVTPTGKVVAFEPQSFLYDYLIRLKRKLKWKNVTVESIALSDKNEKATLFLPRTVGDPVSSPGATLAATENNVNFKSKAQVITETLDSYCSRYQLAPSFLKIDVEGHELKVIQGGIEVLKKYQPKIIVELESRHVGQAMVLETIRFLQDLGYRTYFIHAATVKPFELFNFDYHQNVADKKNYSNNFIFEINAN